MDQYTGVENDNLREVRPFEEIEIEPPRHADYMEALQNWN